MIRFIDCAVFDGQLLDIYSIIAIKIGRRGRSRVRVAVIRN